MIVAIKQGDTVTVHLRESAMAFGAVERLCNEGLYLTGRLVIDGAAQGPGDEQKMLLPMAAIVAVVIGR